MGESKKRGACLYDDQGMRKRGFSRRFIELEIALTGESQLGFSVVWGSIEGESARSSAQAAGQEMES